MGTVGDLGGDGFGDGKPALTKGDYHLPAVLTKKPLKRKVKESDNALTGYHVSPMRFDKPKINQHAGCGTSFYGAGFYVFLDHDKVTEYVDRIGDRGWYEYEVEIDPSANVVGEDADNGLALYAELVDRSGGDELTASAEMVSRGVDGIRYFSPEDGDSIVFYNPDVVRVVSCKPLQTALSESTKITLSWGQLKRLIKGECGK